MSCLAEPAAADALGPMRRMRALPVAAAMLIAAVLPGGCGWPIVRAEGTLDHVDWTVSLPF